METLVGTHNSATGEKPSSILSYLGAPIGKCQNKTIWQQCKAGVRLFDLRVKPYRRIAKNKFRYPSAPIKDCSLGHGLCDYKITLKDALKKIDDYCTVFKEKAYVLVTLEGELNEESHGKFTADVYGTVADYKNVTLLEVNIKKPVWKQLWRNPSSKVTYTQEYPLITGWKALFPFPRFWNRFIKYKQNPMGVYSLRDFV